MRKDRQASWRLACSLRFRGDTRRLEDLREESAERSSGCNESGPRVSESVAEQRRSGLLRESRSMQLPGMMWKGAKAGMADDFSELMRCGLILMEAWLHPEWEDAVQQWYNWRRGKDEKDEEKWREEEHQKFVSPTISSAEGGEGGAGFLHRITKPTAWRGGLQVFQDLEE